MENTSDDPRKLPYQFIREVTNDFHVERVLGSGTFGTVYKGINSSGEETAVKVLHMTGVDDSEFQKEFRNLKSLRHDNIVELVGFCNEAEEVVAEFEGNQVVALKMHTALCLEYVSNGSLQKHISDENTGLNWHIRYKIIKGICVGLKYLHEGLEFSVWHLDLKPDNILLDQNMEPKIADFGLSRLLGDEKTRKTMSAVGTCGYWPPEYLNHQIITKEFDIFSLGVIITKIMTGREGYTSIADMRPGKFVKHVHNNWRNKLCKILRPASLEVYCNQVKRCIEIALECLKPNRQERPTIQYIVSNLEETETVIGDISLHIEQFNNDGESTLHSESNVTSGHSSGGGEASSSTYFDTPTAKAVPFQLLESMTDGFSEERIIGKGEFTRVYKGVYENGQVIAVKRYHSSRRLNDNEFENEIQYLMKVHHPNIIQLVGYCMHTEHQLIEYEGKMVFAEIQNKVLCLEYCSNGSLDQHLSDISYGLDWLTRYRIIKGTCEGLRQLHERSSPIIHMDLNPSNIFLGECMVPKIGDFALARVLEDEYSIQTIRMIGTRGYMPPEFIDKQVISIKSDIYSLGVVIIEIMTGKKYHAYFELSIQELIENVHENWRKRLRATFDDTSGEGYCQQVKKCIKLALSCVEPERLKRPSIGEIIDMLNETETFIHELTLKDKSELLDVHPVELYFPFEPKKATSCSLRLNNKGSDRVAFMVMAKTQKMYSTKLPFCSVVPPGCSYTIAVTIRKQNQQLPSAISEFFTVQSVAVGDHDLKHVDEDSASVVYGNFFKKAEEMNSDELQEMTLPVCWDLPAEGTESEPNQSRIEIIATLDSQQVSSVEVHPSQPWIMTTHHGGSLRVWDYQTMATLQSFQVTDEPVHAAKFIEREKWIIAGDGNGCIHVYSYEEKEPTSFDAHDSGITSLAVHPTQTVVLSFSHDDHLIKLWDWEKDWECTRTFQGHTNRVTQITFNPNGADSFTSVSRDGKVKIWSVHSDGSSPITFDGDDQGLLCVDYFTRRNRQHLITGCMDGTAKIWDLEMDILEGCVHKLEGHEGRVTAVNLHPELPLLITGSLDGTVRLWDSTTYKLENIIGFNLGAVYGFGFIKGLRRLVVGCHQGIAMMEIPSP
ncbi:uncharacterized protein LOC100845829 isoform X1 [Brachypodium distachyon]|uniref:Protein kinase domain-containing protein n=3 Tax=Brachypodium distachyon TaxID=15368 RepID=A0A2K2CPC2_BRADI|nr:uncharacterized protein LOC100845829 isoform X1 [Brachypodium distachyon]PNT63875.1 hypothetical protein BRADI_4g21980v3 [Brachypodium distachyon]|eukprot:XP_024311005.1 uncharacterized protein LOC100845829 isoform X1 [Brachypodium distachyon]